MHEMITLIHIREEEFSNLKSQVTTSSLEQHGGRIKLPYVFTEKMMGFLKP